jgi:tRNA 5-methylaminomethyl-2-thiouridine biosynthesis bifunctional protein
MAADTSPSAVTWDESGAPRSTRHGDVYFSRDDGLAESRAVFLAGCRLPQAWNGRRGFTVGELGFGTGLNIAALLMLWNTVREPGAWLRVFTIEAEPLTAAEARRALSAWPELAPVASLMTARWPGKSRGFHRIDLPEFAATVDVAIMEALPALEAWRGAADAWFLDGFAPALNPDIWRDAVLRLVAERSAAGARAATYTVAGAVRRGLEAAGFTVMRAPGHGRKRERLEASLPGCVLERPLPTVAIIGAGLAGAALSRAFRDQGLEALVIDAMGPGSGASGGPAGLMAPRLDAGLGPAAALFAQAARRAAQLYEATPAAILSRGALQLPVGPKDPSRFAAIAASDLFEAGTMSAAPGPEAAGEGLEMAAAMVARPAAVLAQWLGKTVRARVASLQLGDAGWRLLDERGEMIAEAAVVCIAAAMGSASLTSDLAMTPVRGQASFTSTSTAPWPKAMVFGAYVIPMADGLLFGATHDRGETGTDVREEDRARNLAAVRAVLPGLAGRLAASPLSDWCAIRATTRDFLPLAGPAPCAPAGLWLLTGLGSRGLCLAPLLAEDLAARIVGAPSPLPAPLAALTDPGRFAARAARKGRPRQPVHRQTNS